MDYPTSLPYLGTYWVIPQKFFAGENPAVFDLETTRKRVIAMIRFGVKTIVDLTRHGDAQHAYEEILLEEAALYGVELTRKNYPIADFGTPSVSEMKEILDYIDSEIASQKLVYVHCLAGIGRTGTVVGCYLVRHGYPGERALQQLSLLRSNTPNWWMRSPENQGQVDFILNWSEGRSPVG